MKFASAIKISAATNGLKIIYKTLLILLKPNSTNQDIAASIIGHIRRAAIGEALISFEQRVTLAMQRIYQNQAWSPNQRKWLDRLAKQLVHEVGIDQGFVNDVFGDDGGAKQLNKVLNNKLDEVLKAINEGLWAQASP